jgi:hypothetical protein
MRAQIAAAALAALTLAGCSTATSHPPAHTAAASAPNPTAASPASASAASTPALPRHIITAIMRATLLSGGTSTTLTACT